MNTFTVVILCAGVILLVVALALAHRKNQRIVESLSDEDRELHERCKAADHEIKIAERKHKRAVAEAQTVLKKAETPERLAAADSRNFVTPIDVTLNGHKHPLTPDIEAVLESDGAIVSYATQRSTVTRIAAGGMIGGRAGAIVGGVAKKDKHHSIDNRELFLKVMGPTWQEVVKLDPQQGQKARSLLQTIELARRNCATAAVEHMQRVADAKVKLDAAQADTAEWDTAKKVRADLGEDPYEVAKQSGRGRAKGGSEETTTEESQAVAEGSVLPFDAPREGQVQDETR